MEKIDLLRKLEKEGILQEDCPERNFWRFRVLQPLKLPEELQVEYQRLGEIRW